LRELYNAPCMVVIKLSALSSGWWKGTYKIFFIYLIICWSYCNNI